MRKIILIAAIGLVRTAGAQQPLTIIDQDYELAKSAAAGQRKLLIVDFYTTWCVPCKMLDKLIFKNDSIAREIGRNFVVLKYDAERDTVHHLSLKHHICSYPTTVVLTGDGRLVHKMFGTGGGAESLVASYTALLRESLLLYGQGKYIAGFPPAIDPAIYPEFYKKYVNRTADIRPGDLSGYWAANKDLMSEVSVDILAYFGQAPEWVTGFFMQHRAEYEQRFGQADVQFIVNGIAAGKFHAAVTGKDEVRYKAAVKFVEQHLPPASAAGYIKSYSLSMEIAMKRWDKAAAIVGGRIRLKQIGGSGINEFCWNVYEQCNDKGIIRRAVQWMRKVVKEDPSFAPLDTYARLLFKSGDRDAAIAAMKRAIEQGKANGEDTRESEEAFGRL